MPKIPQFLITPQTGVIHTPTCRYVPYSARPATLMELAKLVRTRGANGCMYCRPAVLGKMKCSACGSLVWSAATHLRDHPCPHCWGGALHFAGVLIPDPLTRPPRQ